VVAVSLAGISAMGLTTILQMGMVKAAGKVRGRRTIH
jgi:hypothetical protein